MQHFHPKHWRCECYITGVRSFWRSHYEPVHFSPARRLQPMRCLPRVSRLLCCAALNISLFKIRSRRKVCTVDVSANTKFIQKWMSSCVNSFQSLHWVGKVNRVAKLATVCFWLGQCFHVISWKISDWQQGAVLLGVGPVVVEIGGGGCVGAFMDRFVSREPKEAHLKSTNSTRVEMQIQQFAWECQNKCLFFLHFTLKITNVLRQFELHK